MTNNQDDRRPPGRPRETDQRISVGFPRDLLEELTEAAKAAGHSREREIRNRCDKLRTDR